MENNEIETCKLLYNTERVRLYIPEYGRNVQKMVNYLKTIEDREKRNEQARAIIKVMEILNPAVHLEEDFEHKLWDHLFIISGFDLVGHDRKLFADLRLHPNDAGFNQYFDNLSKKIGEFIQCR